MRTSTIQIETGASERFDIVCSATERIAGISMRDFILKFDTLGSSCEFGFLQRNLGAEPLSLLRFAGIALSNMVRGLDDGFAELGNRLAVHEHAGHWVAHDPTYGISYHTWRPVEGIAESEILRSEPQRLRFLGRKLLTDVTNAEKIFVVWRPVVGLSEEEVVPLFEAVRRRSTEAILVYLAPGFHVGSAVERRPGLIEGRIRCLRNGHAQGVPDIRGWLETLVNAAALARAIDA